SSRFYWFGSSVRYYPGARDRASDFFQRFGFKSDVLVRLKSDESIDDALRAAALEIASAREGDPEALNAAARRVAGTSGGGSAAYDKAQRQAARAVELAPWDPQYANTLALA